MSNLLWIVILILILSIVSIMDYRYFRIPNSCSFALGCMGIIESVSKNRSLVQCVSGFLSINVVLILIYLITQRKGIGGGDIKLLSASGWLLGWKKNILAFFIASLIVVFYHMIFKKIQLKKDTIRFLSGDRLAFGPYLSFGIFISYIAGDMIIQWYENWPGL